MKFHKKPIWLAATVGLIGVAFAPSVFHHVTAAYFCESEILSTKASASGNVATVEEIACDSMASSDDYHVVLKRAWFQSDIILFNIVVRDSSKPEISWTGPKDLLISVDKVSYLTSRLESADKMVITYKIGSILHFTSVRWKS